MFKTFLALITISLSVVATIGQSKISNDKSIVANATILANQSLPLAFSTGNFYSWNENDATNNITGVFTNASDQSYLLNTNGTYNNLDLQVSNFTRFNDTLGIATLSNFHESSGNNFINQSFLMNKDGVSDTATNIKTPNHSFINFGTNIVSTDVGADLINTSGVVTNLVTPYRYGLGKTSFTPINDTFGVFVGGDQNCYILKSDSTIKPVLNGTTPLMTLNPILLNCFVAINDTGGIIRNIDGLLYYLSIDTSGTPTITPLTLDGTTSLFSFTTNFFTKTNNNEGILNVSIVNSSKFFGQPYDLDVTDINDIKFVKINDHYMNNFVLLHNSLGVFIDDQAIGYFVDDTFAFTKIGACSNFQRINDNLGLIDNINGKSLLSDSENSTWSRINTIKFSNTTDKQISNFINSYIDEGKTTKTDRRNNWVSTNNLILSVTNSELENITIDSTPPLLPDSNNNITTIINKTSTIVIKFKDGETFKYIVTIYSQDTLPTLNNSTNINLQYVGIVGHDLYDINSSNTTDGFTVNFKYDTTIQFLNIITIDSSNMNKMNLWTLKPSTSFTLSSSEENKVYVLQTVDWNNVSSWKYFIIYRNTLPIIQFWTTKAGIELWNAALRLNYTASQLWAMNAKQVNNLRNLSVNWKITETRGNILGYIMLGVLAIAFILAMIAVVYDWYLKRDFKIKNIKRE